MTTKQLTEIRRLSSEHPLADRAKQRRAMDGNVFDVIVVGGGITGAGIALDAVTRGLRVALLERDDFASGTSSRSSKMIHGGLRYLQTGDLDLVRESLRERHFLHKNAPHLVRLLPFMIPMFKKGGVINPKIARAMGGALWTYFFGGGWRIRRRHRRLNAAQVMAHMPVLKKDSVGAGYLYYDLRADDARLTMTLVASAVAAGASALNHAEVVGITSAADGSWNVEATTPEGTITLSSAVVVNAAGVWSDTLRGLTGTGDEHRLTPARGVHIVVPRDLIGNDVAVNLPVRGDRRTISVVHDGPVTYIGTTDTVGTEDIDKPTVTEADVDYLLNAVNSRISTTLKRSDVIGGWSGFRPLLAAEPGKRSADLSRHHRVTTDAPGFISITGGKLTTYRKMAEDTVDAVVRALGKTARCRTKSYLLYSASASSSATQGRLVARYGSDAERVAALCKLDPELERPLTEHSAVTVGEAVFGLYAEMGSGLVDVLFRRTRVGLMDGRTLLRDLDQIADRIARWTDWDDAEKTTQREHLRQTLVQELGVLAE